MGILLAAFSFEFSGFGEGTYAPMLFNASIILSIIPGIGIIISFFGTPFLWAFYYFAIPKIKVIRTKAIVIALMFLLHVAPGALLTYLDREFIQDKIGFGLYSTYTCIFLCVIGVLILLPIPNDEK